MTFTLRCPLMFYLSKPFTSCRRIWHSKQPAGCFPLCLTQDEMELSDTWNYSNIFDFTVYAPLSSVYTKPPLPCRHVRWLGSSVHIAPASHDPGLTRPGPRQCQYPPPRELRAEVFILCHPPRCQKPQHFNYCCEQHELSHKNEWVRGRGVLGNYHIQKQLESEMPRWQLMRAPD